LYGPLVIADPDSQIRKSRKCAGLTKKSEIKRKVKSKNYRNENISALKKEILTFKDSLGKNEKEGQHICNDFDLPDQCDACYTCQTIFTNSPDNPPRDTLASQSSTVNDTLDVPWCPHIFGLSEGDDFILPDNHHNEDKVEKGVLVDGHVVCSLVVPLMRDWTSDYDQSNVTTPDSDKDSGVFSEEQSLSYENTGGHLGKACGMPYDETEYAHHTKSGREVREIFDQDKLYQENECRNVYHDLRSPFERKVWKRRNGRYKVRTPMCPPQLYKATINYADHEGELGSQGSAETGPNYQEHFKFLRDIEDIEAGKECNFEIERDKISLNQGTSDSDPPRKDTLDSTETIEVNDQPTYHGRLTDFQVKLAQMKLEIAEMVAEAAELDNILGESGDEINDVRFSHDRHYTLQPENSEFSESESNDFESESEDDSDDVLTDYTPSYSE